MINALTLRLLQTFALGVFGFAMGCGQEDQEVRFPQSEASDLDADEAQDEDAVDRFPSVEDVAPEYPDGDDGADGQDGTSAARGGSGTDDEGTDDADADDAGADDADADDTGTDDSGTGDADTDDAGTDDTGTDDSSSTDGSGTDDSGTDDSSSTDGSGTDDTGTDDAGTDGTDTGGDDGGSGTTFDPASCEPGDKDPIFIDSPSELATIAQGNYYKLSRDITISSSWVPRPFSNIILDGNGFEFDDVRLIKPGVDYVGVFTTATKGCIRNLKIDDGRVEGGTYVGTLAGYISGTFTLENITVEDTTVAGDVDVGGLVGASLGTSDMIAKGITFDSVAIEGTTYVGGIVGYIDQLDVDGVTAVNLSITGSGEAIGGVIGFAGGSTLDSTIQNADIRGSILGRYKTGGIIGFGTGIDISNCIVRADVKMNSSFASGFSFGGVAGEMWQGTIADCVNHNRVEGPANVGGALGKGNNQTRLEDTDVYGNVQGLQDAGGLVGKDGGVTIVNSNFYGTLE